MLALTNGKLFTVTNGVIENGTILIEDGKITAIGQDVKIPRGAKKLDCSGKWVTPGFIEAHCHVGIMGEPMSRPGPPSDVNEMTDPITPSIDVLDGFDARAMGFKFAREAGFTAGCILPGSANLIGGKGGTFKFKKACTVEEMYIPGTAVMKFALGENVKLYGGKGKPPMTRMQAAAFTREALQKACEYAEKKKADPKTPTDPKMEALVPVVQGKMKARIHAHRVDDINTALRLIQEFKLNGVLEHCTEGFMIADKIAKLGVPAIIGPFGTAYSKSELNNRNWCTPAILNKAGSHVALCMDGDTRTNLLPGYVGYVIAKGGLSWEDALEGVTINAAKILDLDDRMGSLEVGKDADIAVFTGDPFCNYTLCTNTIIDGELYENENFVVPEF
ncbi:MAG: amidohydrolase family protein [Firmicutes bacterium]|nr:amidohydrolase family protein [Bacillota bacterium]MBQ4371013.1 amidohydrolase family protein [Bacillota bacterium]